MYWKRLLEKAIKDSEKSFPIIVITGARQSGKSTILEHYLHKRNGSFISLDSPIFRNQLSENPLEYLQKLKKPVVVDEIQYFPELTSYIKILVDKDRTPGQWYITGSQQFSVMKNVSESLAGRAAILSLTTFQLQERREKLTLENYLLSSTYPEPVTNKNVDLDIWYSSYIQTYLERDVRSMMNIDNLRDFEQFIRFLAGRTSQELNYSIIARELGLSVPTIKRWVSVLEASYIIFLLPPFYKNFNKRLIKSPKLYFYDIGLVNHLVGIRDINILLNGPLSGAIFETAVVSEIIKKKYALGTKPELYFWRAQSGIELDLIIPEKGSYIPCEIKLSSTIKSKFYKNIKYWLDLTKQIDVKGKLITNCNEDIPLPANVENIYWKKLNEIGDGSPNIH